MSLPPGSLTPGETADVWWMPTQAVLATATAEADGSLAATTVALPGPLEPGRYDVVVRGDASAPRLALASVVVASPSPSPTPEAAATRPAGGGAWWLLVLLPFGVALAYHAAIAWRRRRRAAP